MFANGETPSYSGKAPSNVATTVYHYINWETICVHVAKDKWTIRLKYNKIEEKYTNLS